MLKAKRYWIVGASEGLGRALAYELDKRGAQLVLSARNKERLDQLASELANAQVQTVDVLDDTSVAEAFAQIGPFDGLVYCAGFYEPITAEHWDHEVVMRMCDINFTGALRVLGHVVPAFAARNSGHLVMIGSLAGHRGLPGAIGYGASKAALMHLAENIAADLFATKVTVQVINPGFIRTRLTDKNDFDMPMIMSPEKAAKYVADAMQGGRFTTSFPAPFAWLFTLGKYLPRRLFWRLFHA